MHPRVNEVYQQLAEKYEMKGPFLEIGVGHKQPAILSGPYFANRPDRFATNLAEVELEAEEAESIRFTRCNSQDMTGVFADGQFGTVLSNAVLEHDKYFWRSLDEMKRVLAPGGILAVGAPAYIPRSQIQAGVINDKVPKATATLDMHSRPDYWRFSPMAFTEVICEGLELLDIMVVLRIPVLVAVARKPLDGLLPPVAQEDRLKFYQVPKESKDERRAAKLKDRALNAKDETSAANGAARNGHAKGDAADRKRAPAAAKGKSRDEKQREREARLQAHASKLQARKASMTGKVANTVAADAEDDGEPEAPAVSMVVSAPPVVATPQDSGLGALLKNKLKLLRGQKKEPADGSKDGQD